MSDMNDFARWKANYQNGNTAVAEEGPPAAIAARQLMHYATRGIRTCLCGIDSWTCGTTDIPEIVTCHKCREKMPPQPARNSGDADYIAILEEMKKLHIKKSADYGSDEDALANVRGAADVGLPSSLGAWVRAKDKVFRIDRHFKGKRLVNESVQDSLMDLASYCLITLKFLREEKASGE